VFPLEFIEALKALAAIRECITSTSSLTTRAASCARKHRYCAAALSHSFCGRIVLVDDITERVTLETQLARPTSSAPSPTRAGVAHEINTPLAVISSTHRCCQAVARRRASQPVLDKITQQSFRAAEIANGLLNFSRTSTTSFSAPPT